MAMNQVAQDTHRNGLSQAGTGELVQDLVAEGRSILTEGVRLLRAEVEIAKQDVQREAKKVGPAAATAGAGGVLIHAAVLMLAVTLGAALSQAMPVWLAFLITCVVFGAAGGGLVLAGRAKLRAVQLKPTHAIHNLEEDRQWTKELMQDARSNIRHET
jgi:Putative Actinobacterial Holin-X, holin superfamily III